jgi:hypothetical protein
MQKRLSVLKLAPRNLFRRNSLKEPLVMMEAQVELAAAEGVELM